MMPDERPKSTSSRFSISQCSTSLTDGMATTASDIVIDSQGLGQSEGFTVVQRLPVSGGGVVGDADRRQCDGARLPLPKARRILREHLPGPAPARGRLDSVSTSKVVGDCARWTAGTADQISTAARRPSRETAAAPVPQSTAATASSGPSAGRVASRLNRVIPASAAAPGVRRRAVGRLSPM